MFFRSPVVLEKLALDWSRGAQASRLDVEGHRVELSDGKLLEFDVAVIATDLIPRSLASSQGLQGVFVLRTLDDALALRHTLAAGKRLVVQRHSSASQLWTVTETYYRQASAARSLCAVPS